MSLAATALSTEVDPLWAQCRFLTCSVLPVRMACNLHCPFCFSRSSISSLEGERVSWKDLDVEAYFEFARARGANRLVITGGGEPLLRASDTVDLIRRGKVYFDEIACFSNGTYLTRNLSDRLVDAGLSYLCYSRHHDEDEACRRLMGASAPTLDEFFAAAGSLRVRATCVMTRDAIDSPEAVWRYIHRLADFGVREFTFKHTYVAYSDSVFGSSSQNAWAADHQVQEDPFVGEGTILFELPWGPVVRNLNGFQVCYYFEPHPDWEKEHRICRSINLLSDGSVYASLEQQQSRLFQLSAC